MPTILRRAGVLLAVLGVLVPAVAAADVLDELREKLAERRSVLREIEEKVAKFREETTRAQREATTLRGQIRVVEGQVTQLILELDKTKVEIDEAEAESAALLEEIRRAEEAIAGKREQLRETVRLLQALQADSLVETFFKYPSLTSVFVEAHAVERLQRRTTEALGEIKELKHGLAGKASVVEELSRELAELKVRQDSQKRTLEEQKRAKERLYTVTRTRESEFQRLLVAAAAEQRKAQAEIARIETEVRAELEARGLLRLGGVGTLDWPVDPLYGIACGFHCPDYPYRHLLGPHTGIDIPADVGTVVRAAAEGFVARARDAGGPGYSYVLLLHGEKLSTVYGHLSSLAVTDGAFVTRGQILGGTGGIPGSRGAGLSTGPHLHFEVREKGIPVNPARFLP